MINIFSPADFQPQIQSFPGDKPDKVDLYADLFAALFSVEVPAKWVDPLKNAQPPESDFHAKPTTESLAGNIQTPQFTGSGDVAPESMVPPAVPTGPHYLSKTEFTPVRPQPVEFLGLPISETKVQKPKEPISVFGPNERIPITLGDTCGFPTDRDTPIEPQEIAAVPPISSPDFDQKPTEMQTIGSESATERDETNLLELPAEMHHVPSRGDAEPVLEIATVERIEIVKQDVAPLAPSVEPSMIERLAPLLREFHSDKREIKPEREEHSAEQPTTLLETFTANVMVDTRSRDTTSRTAAMQRADATEFVEEISISPIKPRETENAADFSFESSVGSEPTEFGPAPFEIPEAKLQQEIVRQVGSSLIEMIKGRVDSVSEKREITLKLKPEELGTVEITLAKNADGIVEAHFVTDNPQTQHLLDATLAQLRESLEASGVKVGSLQTSCGSSFSDGNGGNGGQREPTAAIFRTTFDEPIRAETVKDDRLVSLRA